MYMEFLAKRTENQRSILPRIATPKFAASKYYDLLQQRVGDSADGQCGNGPRNDCTVVPCPNGPSDASMNAGSVGLDMLLTGQTFIQDSLPMEELQHKSVSTILQSVNEGTRCNFQGVALVCDDEPRDVANSAPGKRRISSADNKCADAILSDKTGVIFVSFWGVAAVQICGVWRSVVNRRKPGEPIPCVVDLHKVRVQGVPKDNSNGESATRIRWLSTIEGVGA